MKIIVRSPDTVRRLLDTDCLIVAAFSFLKFIDVTPSEVSVFHSLPTLERQLRAIQLQQRSLVNEPYKE